MLKVAALLSISTFLGTNWKACKPKIESVSIAKSTQPPGTRDIFLEGVWSFDDSQITKLYTFVNVPEEHLQAMKNSRFVAIATGVYSHPIVMGTEKVWLPSAEYHLLSRRDQRRVKRKYNAWKRRQ